MSTGSDIPDHGERRERVTSFLRAHQGDIARLVKRHGRGQLDFHEIRDLSQEVCYKIVRGRTEIPTVEASIPWLSKVARRVVIDFMRSATARRKRETYYAAQRRQAAGAELTGQAALWDTLEAIKALPAADRAALAAKTRALVEGTTNLDIAAQLDISVHAAEGRVRRALEKARLLLSDRDENETSSPDRGGA